MNILKIPSRSYGNPGAEATLQRQRGLVPNTVVTTNRLASVDKPLETDGYHWSVSIGGETW